MNFRVWAPRAKERPTLVLWDAEQESETAARTVEMQDHGAGWFEAASPTPVHGSRYAFSLGGDKPLPDPRSRLQPDGVHGPSAWVEPQRFEWVHRSFRPVPWASAVVYELHIGTFTEQGTFDAACERLDHLVDLGITHVEVMPVATFPGDRGWGYDGVDLFAPHAVYGGPQGFARFIDACHGRGLAVLLDVVYNHLGPSGNYLGEFAPYFSKRYNTPWGDAVNFDSPGSDEVRRFICDNALYWLREYRLDGLRLDAIHEIYDSSAHHVLRQLSEEVEALSAHLERPLVLVAESASNDPRTVRPRERGGHGLTSQWADDFHHAVHAALTGERIGYYEDFGQVEDVAEALIHGFVYRGRYSTHRGYSFGDSTEGLVGSQFVAFSQNHDQVGNRALGERLSTLTNRGRLRIAAALTLLGPAVPLLFMGEEWGTRRPFQYFTHHSDPQLADAVSRGRRREFSSFGWKEDQVPDPQAESTFRNSKLDWAELSEQGPVEYRRMFDFYRQLLRIRRSEPELRDGRPDRLRVTFSEEEQWLCMRRGNILLICNWGSAPRRIPIEELPGFVADSGPIVRADLDVLLHAGGDDSAADGSAADGSAKEYEARAQAGLAFDGRTIQIGRDAMAVLRLWRVAP